MEDANPGPFERTRYSPSRPFVDGQHQMGPVGRHIIVLRKRFGHVSSDCDTLVVD